MSVLHTETAAQERVQWPRLLVSDGTIEALKWLALVSMTLDHANKYLFDGALQGASEIGRLAMPLFGFVLAYNLARPNIRLHGVHIRVMARLAVFGLFATPFYVALGDLAGGWWPLNIMFTLLVATGMVFLAEKGGPVRAMSVTVLFLVGGAFVDYGWFGLAFCLTAWWYCRAPGWLTLAAWLAASTVLCLVSDNLWVLAALPIIFVAPHVALRVPRFQYAFYLYYPVHLAVLAGLS